MLGAPSSDPWLQYRVVRPQARLRLFCFPYAGGSAAIFRNWSEYLPVEIEVCPVQLPGRERRLMEKPFCQLDELIMPLTQALLPYLDRPYAFFGHSMGGLISFELTRALRRQGYPHAPTRLCVSGRRAPQIPDPDPPTYHLPEEDFIAELRRLQGTPEEVLQNKELLHILLPLLRADFELCETYQYRQESTLTCPISAFGGTKDLEVSRAEVTAWQAQTRGKFKLRFFVGDHFFLHEQQLSLLSALAYDLSNDVWSRVS